MSFIMSYSVTVQSSAGEVFVYTGSQTVNPAGAIPVASDFSAATTAMGSDIQAKIAALFLTQFAADNNPDSGGGNN